jgi:phosphoribosyl-dephospho-CoA transferase
MQTHSLLQVSSVAAVSADMPLPRWALQQLTHAPWVVVRRQGARAGAVPVGVRGSTRAERCAAWVRPPSVLASLTPIELAARRGWRAHPRRAALPALCALDAVESIMAEAGLSGRWGPGGSVGFELASGHAAVGPRSDLDVIVQLPAWPTHEAARALEGRLCQLPVRIDVLLETPDGGLALSEYARGRAPFLLRTAGGPRLVG